MKKPYIVLVQEYYHKNIIVWADDKCQAADIAERLCDSGKIEMERNCYVGQDVDVGDIVSEEFLHEYDQYEEG